MIQPADAGIIKCLKGHYRSALCSRLLNLQSSSPDSTASSLIKKITVLDTVYLVAEAWKKVKQSAIENCWKFAFREDMALAPNVLQDIHVPLGSDHGMLTASIMNIENLEKEANEMMEEEEETFAEAPGAEDEEEKEDEEGEQVKPAECLVALSTVRKFCQANAIDFGT